MTETQKAPAVQPRKTMSERSENAMEQTLIKIAQYRELGVLNIPADYSPENAIRAAWLDIQELEDKNNKPVLEVCKPTTVASALMKMVVNGLSYVKGQCYFIPYGDELVCDISYLGDIAIAKREIGLKDINAVVVYEGDEFDYEINPSTGIFKVNKHVQKLENIVLGKELGVYAVAVYADGTVKTGVMTMQQVRLAWAQGSAKGNSPAHKNFPEEMAKKTCIYRTLKIDKGSSDDSHLNLSARPDPIVADLKQKLADNGHKEKINFDEAQMVEETPIENSIKETPAQGENSGPGF